MNKNEKAGYGGDRSSFKPKTFLIAGGNQKRFDVSNYAENHTKTQEACDLCSPKSQIKSGVPVELCSNCTAAQIRLESELLAQFIRPRKVIRLHRCSGCQRCVTPSRFSRDWGICKSCVADAQSKSKLAQSNFIERAVNNFRKSLRGVVAL